MIRCHRNGAAAQRLGFGNPGRRAAGEGRQRPREAAPGIKPFRRQVPGAPGLGMIEFRLDTPDHMPGDFVLKGENIRHLAIVSLCPEVISGCRVDELRCNAQTLAALSHAALKHIPDAELAADLLDVDGSPPIGEYRIAGGDEKPADPAQYRNDLLDHAVGEELEFRIARHVLERQHRD
jgi:hypothetical protein